MHKREGESPPFGKVILFLSSGWPKTHNPGKMGISLNKELTGPYF
jgi:hypothetical protein